MRIGRSHRVALAILCTTLPAPAFARAGDAPAPSDAPLAAGAGTYFSFFVSGDGAIPAAMRAQLPAAFLSDLLEPRSLTMLGIDARRSIVHSSTIVDPAYLRERLASPQMPPSFVIRALVVVPVLDADRAEAALDQTLSKIGCVHRRGPAARWTTWVAQLPDREDRRAAEASDAAYLCVQDRWAVVVRSNPAQRDLRWVIATGIGSLLAAASAPVPPDRELSEQLRRDGFFSARQALYKTPGGDARAVAALGLNKTLAGLSGVAPELHPTLWQRGSQELGAPQRLIDSPPLLFSGFLAADGVLSWTLTAEGRRFFSSLGIRSAASTKSFKSAIAKKLKPGGVFADAAKLSDTIHEAGNLASLLVRHELWPHAIAFAAAHPGANANLATEFDDEAAHVELDLAAGRVRLRRSGAR